MHRRLTVPIAQLEAYNYKCLQAVRQPLERFLLLVGRNGTGKSTFLDVLSFFKTALAEGVQSAIFEATEYRAPRALQDFRDLLYKGGGSTFTIAVVLNLPEQVRALNTRVSANCCRYQVQIGIDESEVIGVLNEAFWLLSAEATVDSIAEKSLLGSFDYVVPRSSMYELRLWDKSRTSPKGWYRVLRRHHKKAELWTEKAKKKLSQTVSTFRLALGLVDEERFPAASWVARFLQEDVLALQLNPRRMRSPCPATASETLELDGSNLPKVVKRFAEESPEQFRRWVRTVQGVTSSLRDIEVRRREEDNALYLVLRYRDYEVKQWAVSEGTLRLLALTLIGYLPETEPRVWIIEEPENGVHPQALEYIIQSLATAQNSQFLIATHSPMVLGFKDFVTPQTLLCFRQEDDATIIQRGAELAQEGDLPLGRLLEWGVL